MDQPVLQNIIAILWLGWLAIWVFAARSAKTTNWREPFLPQLVHTVPVLLAAILLGLRPALPVALTQRFMQAGVGPALAGAILVAAGLLFSIWARFYLGRNWSAEVTLKEGHTLIRTGPYRYVRHPIYTGVLLAFLGTALAIGEWRGLVAFILAFLGFWTKSRAEERKMVEAFPEYEAYRKSTAALIPFVF